MDVISSALQALDTAARCAICCGPYDTPLVLKGCGHSFCSSCIRQNLDFQERSGPPSCPSCRKPCDARDLQPNTALREVLEKYVAARPLLLELAKERQQQQEAGLAQPQQQVGHQQQSSGSKRPFSHAFNSGDGGGSGAFMQTRSTAAHAAAARDGSKKGQHRLAVAGCGTATCAAAVEEVDLAQANDSSSCSSEPGTSKASDSMSSGNNGIGSQHEGSSGSSGMLSDGSLSSQRWRRPRSACSSGKQAAAPVAVALAAADEAPDAAAAAEAADMPSGFVRCPICGKTVPSFYINSHVDLCLLGSNSRAGAAGPSSVSGSKLQHEPSPSRGSAGDRRQHHQAVAAVPTPFEPLAVPPKIVPALASEKSLRMLLKKYELPTEGKKKELLERYGKLRLAVEMANDKQERTRYGQLAKRIMQQERQKAAEHLLLPAVGKRPSKAVAAAAVQAVNASEMSGAVDGHGVPAAATADTVVSTVAQELPTITLIGCSFRELIAATRQRDAARQAARAKQAGATATEKQPEGSMPGVPAESAEQPGSQLWGEQLPLSQAQQHEGKQRVQVHLGQQQQEQQPPNSRLSD